MFLYLPITLAKISLIHTQKEILARFSNAMIFWRFFDFKFLYERHDLQTQVIEFLTDSKV